LHPDTIAYCAGCGAGEKVRAYKYELDYPHFEKSGFFDSLIAAAVELTLLEGE